MYFYNNIMALLLFSVYSRREFLSQLKQKVQTRGCSSMMPLDRPHPFIPKSLLIVTKKVHFVYDHTAFAPTHLSGNDTLELCPVGRTFITWGSEISPACSHPDAATWASSDTALLHTSWFRGMTVLLGMLQPIRPPARDKLGEAFSDYSKSYENWSSKTAVKCKVLSLQQQISD